MNYLQIVANQIIELDHVSSTNEYAVNLIANSEPIDGMVITAQYQTAGKGQYGRKWLAKEGKSLLLSIILQPHNLAVKDVFLLNICISLAVRKFISLFIKKNVSVKWPNDIYVNNHKIAGILIQNQINSSHVKTSIVGIGINVNQPHFNIKNANPTSLKIHTNKNYNLSILYPKLYSILDQYYLKLRRKQYDDLKEEYINELYKINQLSKFKLTTGTVLEGTIIGLEKNGALIIHSNGMTKSYMMHEIKMIL